MIFEMNLHPEPFAAIINGDKDIEMRLYDDRRKPIKIGDTIIFTNNETKERLSVKVVNLFQYDSFEELYSRFDKKRLGYKEDENANPKDMEKYYSPELIKRFGVLGIEIKLI